MPRNAEKPAEMPTCATSHPSTEAPGGQAALRASLKERECVAAECSIVNQRMPAHQDVTSASLNEKADAEMWSPAARRWSVRHRALDLAGPTHLIPAHR